VKKILIGLAAAIVVANAAPAYSQVRITEVAAWGSSTANPAIPYATDWFELTNFGASAVNITGWKMDDNSNLFANAVALTGITSIGAGESVVFTENPATATFLSTWFGSSAPAGLQIGNYTGGGVGLGQAGDAVNIYNSTGVLQANVIFGASDAASPYQTFDNSAGLNGTTISLLSVVGSNGAFVAVNDAAEIGSPGFIATSVPEPETYALMLAGLCFMGCVARRRTTSA
jgi:hypothetical protein